MDKLIARRDLWSDNQYLELCNQMRPLGAESVRGNVGLGALADLPGMAGGYSGRGAGVAAAARTQGKAPASSRGKAPSSDGSTHRAGDATGQSARARGAARKKPGNLRGSIDSLSECSEDEDAAARAAPAGAGRRKKPRLPAPVGVFGILAEMGCKQVPKARALAQAGDVTLAVGGEIVQVGLAAPKDQQLDALGKRTRRPVTSVEDLQDVFLAEILSWDLRRQTRPGAACAPVPLAFESVDQYEDILSPLLLEEAWEQIVGTFEEERSEVEDAAADFHALQVLSYNEMGEFAFAAVRPRQGLRGCGTSGADEAGSGTWGSGHNEMDLVLLVSRDDCADRGGTPAAALGRARERPHDGKCSTEHALALVDKAQRGDAERGIIRLRVLSRQTPRNRRFSGRLARASMRNGGGSMQGAQGGDSLPEESAPYLQQADAGLRMVCLSYSIATSEREFIALHRLRSLEPAVQRAVLDPRRAASDPPRAVPSSRGSMSLVPQEALNQDQIAAIAQCLEPGAVFRLIQGPPGTGKTSTLVGLLTALVAAPSGNAAGARVLVCAPSNAAVDELALRVSRGLAVQGRTDKYLPNVVRIGSKRQMRREVWDAVGLEQQVLRRLVELEGEGETAKAELDKLKAEVETLTERLEGSTRGGQAAELAAGDDTQALLFARKSALAQCAHRAAAADASESRVGVLKRRLRSQFLDKAQIVFVTLSGAGAALLQGSTRTFDAVIVDEAAQALETSILIPLQLGIDRCILVGDPQQLPATVTSRTADRNLYARSLFERLQAAGMGVQLLAVQYRMHPAIRAFPSAHFYDGKLTDSLGAQGRSAPWHCDIRFSPFVFYNLKGGEDAGPGGTSRSNASEAQACVAMLRALQGHVPGGSAGVALRAAVMSPYRRQCAEIRRRLAAAGLPDVEVASVDSFQGREVDLAILSCVRSGGRGLGFVADVRRLNVALTRARCSLLVIGDATTLSHNEHWAALVAHARSARACVRLVAAQLGEVFGVRDGDRWRTDEWPQALLAQE
jgi:hypothetical protein